MKKPKLYHIRIQRRTVSGFKEFLVWPKVFPTQKECDKFLHECFTFKGLIGTGRKLSATIERCK